MSRSIPIPKSLHEVLGAEQSPLSLALVGLAVVLFVVSWLGHPSTVTDIAWWRQGLAALLILDVVAGAVANFTRGTNAHYATRPNQRWVFIALHVHLPVIALLLGQEVWPVMAVWAYTIVAATIVNLLFASSQQRLVGGFLLVVGLMLMPLLSLTPNMQATSLLFMLKVMFSFAVDHYKK